ncbi:MAG TPA: tyrosine--tRNA ligase [Gammaproteobacteria bacterium]|nr:tyrosine--tRNA ligase [Gammaproteobacteria bacterium]|tara:strand:- start:110 stop:1324 length:1215 start_codon:yes stop_codon:yes gene_type:complete
MTSGKEQILEIKRGVDEILVEKDFLDRLKQSKPLKIKVGFDPTAPDLHLGHTVIINKMRKFQEFGHEVIFLIGDFTGMIGDPSGVNETRPVLTKEQVKENARTYKNQIFKILDKDKTRIEFNSSWMNKITSAELIDIASKYTVARMLERDDFKKRFRSENPISIHEFLYPIVQGYDSVALGCDVEMGGTDQKFNLLVGRHLQQIYGQEPQTIITLPLLEGLDGVKKMSKSSNNYVALNDSGDEMFGKIMSISDDLMWKYFELLSTKNLSEIEKLKDTVKNGANPRDIKFLLSEEIVERFHSLSIAKKAKESFLQRFQKGGIPEDIDLIEVSIKDIENDNGEINLPRLLAHTNLVNSVSEGHRAIKAGSVRIDGEKISQISLDIQSDSELILSQGKRRFIKVKII